MTRKLPAGKPTRACRTGTALVFCLLALCLSPQAIALCPASDDPTMMELARELDSSPARALDRIEREIARTPESKPRRMGWLRIARSNAMVRTGQYDSEFHEYAQQAVARFPKDDPLGYFLRLYSLDMSADVDELREQTLALASVIDGFPAGSDVHTCGNLEIADTLVPTSYSSEAFSFAMEAYRLSGEQPWINAGAASTLSQLVVLQGDLTFAGELAEEALDYFLPQEMHYRAAISFISLGWARRGEGNWQAAIDAFRSSAAQGRLAESPLATAFAIGNVCESLLDTNQLDEAVETCSSAYDFVERLGPGGAPFLAPLQGEMLVRTGQTREGLAVLDGLLEEQRDAISNGRYGARAFKARALAHSQLGDMQAAKEDLDEAVAFLEEQAIKDRRIRSTMSFARFQTEQLKSQLTLQESQYAASMRLFTLATLAGLVVLGLALGLAFVLARHRRTFRQQALTDPLTGLPNRRYTSRRASEIVRHAATRGEPAVFAVIDLDHFKRCNDSYGHEAGDEALKAFADVLRATLRPGDLVGRWGGEEFWIALPNTGTVEAREILQRLRSEAAVLQLERASGYPLRFSSGVVDITEPDDTFDKVVATADKLLYEAKERGRNRDQFAN